MYYIGLDVGTSGCKASVADAGGRVVRYAHRAYGLLSPEPGFVEIDAREVWACVRETLREAVDGAKAGGVRAEQIAALAVASFGESVVCVGADGEPLAPGIYYSDIRGSEEVEDIAAVFGVEEIARITGMPPNPMFSANKLLWIKKHRPELLDRAKYLMLFGDFIAYKLTGERVIDYSLASRTMLFDIGGYKWSEQIASALGLPADKFSVPVQAGTKIGTLLSGIADELGLSRSTVLVAGGHDQPLAALGGGAIRPGQAIIGMGSSECITAVIERDADFARMAEYGFCREPHVVGGRFVTLAFNASAGTAITWFKDCFCADLAAETALRGENIYSLMDGMCGREPTGLLFLPFVGGSGTPYLDSRIGGAFTGLTLASDVAAMYKAVLEGICYELRFNLELLGKLGLAPKELCAVGGGSRSDVLMQIKADILGKPIAVLENWEVGTVALALLCANAMGEAENAEGISPRVSRVYEPDPHNAEVYSEGMARYRNLYKALKGL